MTLIAELNEAKKLMKNGEFSAAYRAVCRATEMVSTERIDKLEKALQEISEVNPRDETVKNLMLLSNPTQHAAVYGIVQMAKKALK